MAQFEADCRTTNAADKYIEYGLMVLQSVRDEGLRSEQQLQAVIRGSSCRWERLAALLKKNKLVRRNRGPHGKYSIPESVE